MTAVTLEEAQAKLPELLDQLLSGEEMTITANSTPVAQVKKAVRTSWSCQVGCYKKQGLWMEPDFDAPLDDFEQ